MAIAAFTPRARAIGGGSIGVPAIIVVAWTAILVAQATGTAVLLHHHALIEDGPPFWLAVPFFLVAWLIMVAAMMLPASLPTIRIVEAEIMRLPRPALGRVAFVGAFALAWATFGLLAFLGDVLLHRVVDATPWLAGRPWLIEAGVLALAGGYQFAPLKRRSLGTCCDPTGLEVPTPLTERGAARAGLRHGLSCLGSSWALMLLMFAESFASLWWMVALTAVMTYETTGGRGARGTSTIGLGLILAALIVASGVPAGGG